MQNQPAQDWTQVLGYRVSFTRAGEGPALLLVHGLLGYSFSWRFAVSLLAEQREVFALDMPGSGNSDCSPDMDCRLQSAGKRLLGFMDSVGISSCDLIGSSYGGATAVVAAALAPERVRTLGLVSPANPWSRIGHKRLAALRNPAFAALFPKVARQVRPLNGYFVRRMYGDASRVTKETLAGYSLPLARRGVFEHAVKIVRTWKEDMNDFQNALSKVGNIPALLIWGSRDRVVDLRSANLLANYFREKEFKIIEGAGHLPYEECPEEFSRIVLAFLQTRSRNRK